MMEIRASKDPEKREQLMETLIKDMEAMMQDGSCPMMAAGKGGIGMMAINPSVSAIMVQQLFLGIRLDVVGAKAVSSSTCFTAQ